MTSLAYGKLGMNRLICEVRGDQLCKEKLPIGAKIPYCDIRSWWVVALRHDDPLLPEGGGIRTVMIVVAP